MERLAYLQTEPGALCEPPLALPASSPVQTSRSQVHSPVDSARSGSYNPNPYHSRTRSGCPSSSASLQTTIPLRSLPHPLIEVWVGNYSDRSTKSYSPNHPGTLEASPVPPLPTSSDPPGSSQASRLVSPSPVLPLGLFLPLLPQSLPVRRSNQTERTVRFPELWWAVAVHLDSGNRRSGRDTRSGRDLCWLGGDPRSIGRLFD